MKRTPKPATLAEWEVAAREEFQNWKEIQTMLQQGRGMELPKQDNTKKNKTPGGHYPSGNTPLPMDVDNATERPAKLTDEERERLRREGRCFRCRKLGHMSKTCPTFSNQSSPRKQASQEASTEPAKAEEKPKQKEGKTFQQKKGESNLAFIKRLQKEMLTKDELSNMVAEDLDKVVIEESDDEDF
jgi:hypothetical protein